MSCLIFSCFLAEQAEQTKRLLLWSRKLNERSGRTFVLKHKNKKGKKCFREDRAWLFLSLTITTKYIHLGKNTEFILLIPLGCRKRSLVNRQSLLLFSQKPQLIFPNMSKARLALHVLLRSYLCSPLRICFLPST